jgi:hypothetical protein
MSRWRALLLYLALSVPFGIAVHLGSEFAGLGRDADDLAFSPLHAYLALIAAAAMAAFLGAGGFFGRARERRRRMALMADALPFRGHGVAFFFLSSALQFGFFVTTQLGEGCPLCHGDVLIGVLAAIVASFAGSLALTALRRCIVRAILDGALWLTPWKAYGAFRRSRQSTLAVRPVYATFASTRGNRPPPRTLPA